MVVCDQWRIGPHGVVLGLDWPAVHCLLTAAGHTFDAELLDRLRLMEGCALDAWAEHRPAAGKG